MSAQTLLGEYVRSSGRTFSWVARRAAELGCKSLNEKKLSASFSDKRGLSADELLYVCKALGVSPDIFMQSSAN